MKLIKLQPTYNDVKIWPAVKLDLSVLHKVIEL